MDLRELEEHHSSVRDNIMEVTLVVASFLILMCQKRSKEWNILFTINNVSVIIKR